MIRPMKISDIPQIIEIEHLAFTVPWTTEDFINELANPRAHYLVMEENEQIIGYAGFWQIFEEGHFTNIAITPAYQQRGLGKKLIEAILNFARTMKIEKVTLEVRESNENALKAYMSLGFLIEGKRSRYYTNPDEDGLIMWLSLQ